MRPDLRGVAERRKASRHHPILHSRPFRSSHCNRCPADWSNGRIGFTMGAFCQLCCSINFCRASLTVGGVMLRRRLARAALLLFVTLIALSTSGCVRNVAQPPSSPAITAVAFGETGPNLSDADEAPPTAPPPPNPQHPFRQRPCRPQPPFSHPRRPHLQSPVWRKYATPSSRSNR